MPVEETRTSGGAVTSSERPSSEQQTLRLSASVESGEPRVTARLTVTPADSVEIEDSPPLKYLRLKTGDFSCYKRIFLVADGQRSEITVDELPQEK